MASELIDFLERWWMVLVIVALIIIYAVYNKVKKSRVKKKKATLETEPVKKEAPKVVEKKIEEAPFSSFNETKDIAEKQESVVEKIRDLGLTMQKNSDTIEDDMKSEFKRIHEKLKVVNEEKEKIRGYGLHLSKLFDKYIEQERYLTTMMMNMEDMIRKEEETTRINYKGDSE